MLNGEKLKRISIDPSRAHSSIEGPLEFEDRVIHCLAGMDPPVLPAVLSAREIHQKGLIGNAVPLLGVAADRLRPPLLMLCVASSLL